MALPSFPEARSNWLRASAQLDARGIALRPMTDADLPFLRTLYAQTRATELAPVPWPVEFKQTFLHDQFDLQHRHYMSFFGHADFLLIEQQDKPIGRLYLLQEPPAFHVIDIALVEAVRGRGVGGALITHAQTTAASLGCGMALHVDRRNVSARRLYEGLGFLPVDDDDDGTSHLAMRWSANQLKTA